MAPGISVKLLATDTERDRVSMLVRLEPVTITLGLGRRGKRLLRGTTTGIDVVLEIVVKRGKLRVSRADTLHFDP